MSHDDLTDIQAQAGSGAPYNLMLTESASRRLDLPRASMAEVTEAVLDALDSLEVRR